MTSRDEKRFEILGDAISIAGILRMAMFLEKQRPFSNKNEFELLW